MDPKRLRDLFPGTYLTLVALVQSVALAILLTKWFDLVLSLLDGQPSSTTPISTHVQFLACLMLIVVAWYEYYWAVWLLTWLPDVRDAVVPFALGTVEVMLIYSVRAPSRFPFFTFAGIVASFVSALAYYNSYKKAFSGDKHARDQLPIELLNDTKNMLVADIGACCTSGILLSFVFAVQVLRGARGLYLEGYLVPTILASTMAFLVYKSSRLLRRIDEAANRD